jgi:hypothetical protein
MYIYLGPQARNRGFHCKDRREAKSVLFSVETANPADEPRIGAEVEYIGGLI